MTACAPSPPASKPSDTEAGDALHGRALRRADERAEKDAVRAAASARTRHERSGTATNWSGTLRDLTEAARLAHEALDQWQPGAGFSLRVDEREGRSVSTSRRAGLDAVAERDPRTIRTIAARVGEGHDDPRADLFLNSRSGLEYRVTGTHEGRVDSLAALLHEVLRKGEGRPRWYQRDLLWPVWIAGSGCVALFLIGLQKGELPLWPGLGLTGSYGVLGFLYWLTPVVELVKPGEKTRWQRFRRLLAVAAVAVVLSVLASAALQG